MESTALDIIAIVLLLLVAGPLLVRQLPHCGIGKPTVFATAAAALLRLLGLTPRTVSFHRF
jgi:hypothetical protein